MSHGGKPASKQIFCLGSLKFLKKIASLYLASENFKKLGFSASDFWFLLYCLGSVTTYFKNPRQEPRFLKRTRYSKRSYSLQVVAGRRRQSYVRPQLDRCWGTGSAA